MGLFECRVAAFVAIHAERRLRLDKEILLVRAVSAMAHRAPLRLQDLMHGLLFKVFLFMALIADGRALGLEQPLPLRGMRVVARRALACLQGLVLLCCLREPDFFPAVAIVTKAVAVLFQQELGDYAVTQMAVIALARFYDRVDVLHGQVLISEFLMAVKTVLLFEFSDRAE